MDRSELAKLYEKTGTLRALGEALGLSVGAARNRLVRAGIPIQDKRYSTERAVPPPKRTPTTAECAMWQQMYDEASTTAELGRRLGLSPQMARYRLRQYGVEIRNRGYSAPRTVDIPIGPEHHNWKGGRCQHSDGYVLAYAPWHPAGRNAKGYVLEHRLVMERHLGRYLTERELVHHKNEIKDDNRIENLEIMTRSDHMSHHKEEFPRDGNGRFTVA